MTKVDADPATGALDRDRVLRSFEESRKRLGVDALPLLHLHDPYTITLREALAPRGAIAGLHELKDAGLVSAVGIAVGPVPLVRSYVETDAFDAVLTHNRYTLIDRSARSLLEDARARGMTVFNAAPFGGGILATGARPGATYAYGLPRPPWPPGSPGRSRSARRAASRFPPSRCSSRCARRSSTRPSWASDTPGGAELAVLRAARIPTDIWAELDALGPAPSPLDDDHDTRGTA